MTAPPIRTRPGADPVAIDRGDTVAQVLADNLYLVLGTADAAGTPWVSPVFFAARANTSCTGCPRRTVGTRATSKCGPPSPSPSSTPAPRSE